MLQCCFLQTLLRVIRSFYLVKRWLSDRGGGVWLCDGEWKYIKVCPYVCVCVACVRACAKLLLVGPSMTAEVGAIICSAVISINTFLDAHTVSQWSCAQHPLRRWPAARDIRLPYHNTAVQRIIGCLNLKPRGAKQTLTSVAPSSWPYRKHWMIYYTSIHKASRSYHARLITG